ncbi:6-hydroxymethylpterin diphosphokinase MptE-like protein [Arcobacter sp.]|uniref:motility associated factor glycosyltransferase family protein n=1 Tax=Arcobacter sp. TaxID=1872629 RepID=UPI003D0BCBA7
MSQNQVQQLAIQTYNENLEYFKQNHPDIYKNLELYAAAIELGQIVPEFELQFLNTHFDIVNPKTKQFLYVQNSNDVSKQIVDGINFDATVNSFKTYYEFKYNDTVAKTALEQDILAPCTIGNAPVINFVNKNLSNPQNLKEVHKFIIFGVLLGIHIPLIHQKLNSKVYLIVEPNLEFFRLSLFVTNYANLAKQTKLFFSVAQNEYEFKKTFESFYGELFIFNHYLKFVNISAGSDVYMKVIQNFLVSQPHLLYSYDRTFLSLSRTNSYISQDFNLLNIKYKQNLKPFEKPVLLLGAGPSLQRNIDFVKQNQDYFTIVAIYATMPILERNGIKPDIITQYDEQDEEVLNTLNKLKNIHFFNNTIFIFASHVNAKLMNSFPKENIFIFQAMFELKENFGILTSPSIGELSYALLLLFQAKELYLLGLDFAMDVESGDTHIEGHSGSSAFNKLKDLEDSNDKNYSFRKNTILVKGNFLPEVKSVPVFKTCIDTFSQFTEMYKDSFNKVFNLSNGAYLNGATPLKIEDIDLSNFTKKEPKTIKEELFNSLASISEAGYNNKDLEKLNLKLSGVKKIKKSLEQFQKIKKYKDFEEYKGQLINLIQNILFEKHHCEDLQSILINYSSHNLHHIFYLFDLDSETDKKKYIYEINKNLCTQLNKIVDTYVISISYSSDENSIALKKLNKYLKEYSIKNSIYSEPFFKELVETSKKGYQHEFESNSMGFLAIEDNLSNKEFITYIKEILKKFPEVKLKLFYFFEFQKIQAQFIFKQELEKVEIIIPHNLTQIANSVEFWLETYDHTTNIKKLDDIILNNYENIYSAMFSKTSYDKLLTIQDSKETIVPKKFILAKDIEKEFMLPNSNYYVFGNSLKDNIDTDLLKEKYLKEHIGFFAFKENLQKDFINHIINICNKFPNIKFSVFYFDEEVVKEFISIFVAVANRFQFITPKSIYDIADNCEVWVQAETKNQSFLFYKIYDFISKTINIHPIVLDEKYELKNSSENYLEAMLENYEETIFAKSLNSTLDEQRLQNTNPEDNIGFLATKDNLEDNEFIKLMTILFEKNYDTRYKAFYFTKEQKEITSKIFENYIDKIDFIIPTNLYDIVENISTYIYSFISYKKPKTTNYHNVWQILNKTKANLFKLHLQDEIKNENMFYDSIDLVDDNKMLFEKSIVSKIFINTEKFNEYCFINSLNQPVNEEIKYSYCLPNTIGFFVTKENIENKEFMRYIDELNSRFKDCIVGFSFSDNVIINNLHTKKVTNIKDLPSCSIFIPNLENSFDKIVLKYIKNNFNNIHTIHTSYINKKYKNISYEEYNKKEGFFMKYLNNEKNLLKLNYKKTEIVDNNYLKTLIQYTKDNFVFTPVSKETEIYEFLCFHEIENLIQDINYIKYRQNLKDKLANIYLIFVKEINVL